MLEECYIYLKECLAILTMDKSKQSFYKANDDNYIAVRMKQLK